MNIEGSAAALALALVMASPVSAGENIAGRWTGIATQSDGLSYEMVLILGAKGRGATDYPSLGCSGLLSPLTPKAETTSRFAETIVGRRAGDKEDGCVDGEITVRRDGERLRWDWVDRAAAPTFTATAILSQEEGR